MVYVCVDAALVTYETVHNIVQQKQSVRESSHTETPKKEMKKRGGHATQAFTIPFKATMCDCRLYIGNLRRNVCCNHSEQENDFVSSNSHSKAGVSSVNGGHSVCCSKDRVFLYQLGLSKKTENEILVGKTVFGYLQRSAPRHQS